MHDIFYFTDIHGMYDLYRAIMDYCHEQDPEAMIIFGGDACDRGKDGYKIMKELLDNPYVLYLKGNHEDLFVHAAWYIKREYHNELTKEAIEEYLYDCMLKDNPPAEVYQHLYNGGFNLLRDWMLDGMPQDFVDRINHLPITFSYNDIDFCHAGGRYKEFKSASDDEYNDEWVDKDDLMMLVWDRNYLGQGWLPDRTCIFGHTPTPYLAAKYYGRDKSLANAHPCAYNATLDDKWTGRKIDMDVGAFASGKAYVLNILTMEAQGFRDTDFENDEIRKHDVEKIEVIQF
jgi:hypothetical protein